MLSCENFSLVSLIRSEIIKPNMDFSWLVSAALPFLPSFFNCPMNYICRIPFGSASNSFGLLKSTAINL